MKYLISKSFDPYFNLAMEEYLIKNCQESIFYLYQNQPCVIIGKNQNPHSEVGIDFIKGKNILLVRRLSGGGAVYQDFGNLNYGFITKGGAKHLYDFKKFCQPIVDVLNKYEGIKVEFSGRNDLLIGDKKISGTAQFVAKDNLIHHGTLLYNTDFKDVSKILLPNSDKLKTKGVKSVISRVGNLKDFLTEDKIDIPFIIQDLVKTISNGKEFIPSQVIVNEVNKIADDKRKAIKFILENKKQYSNQIVEYIPGFGTIAIYSTISNNKIADFEIFGEYFFKNDLDKIKKEIIGIEFSEEAVSSFVNNIQDFEDYFHRLKRQKLISLIMLK